MELALQCKSVSETWEEQSQVLFTSPRIHLGMKSPFHFFAAYLTTFYRFIQGHCILLGLIFMSFCLTSLMTIYYRRENARRAALSINDLSEEELALEREKGDRALFFKYTV